MAADERPRQTHDLQRDGDLITKTYRSWSRQEHRREWETLTRLAVHQPGLAPTPVSAKLDEEPPSVTMTVIPGHPVVGRWTDDQVRLLAESLQKLWQVPCDGMAAIDSHAPTYWRNLAERSRRPTTGVEQQAYDLAVPWIQQPELDTVLGGQRDQILGQGDPQPGNMLYDGLSMRLVDFEDAGASDVCFELANFAEHLGTRGTGLDRLAGMFEHDPQRYQFCRRLLAAFWFFLLLPDPSGARPPRALELRKQARRLVGLFGQSAN